MPKNATSAEKMQQAPAAPQVRNANWMRQGGVAIGCAALFAVFSAMTANFYQPANLLDIMLQSSINAIIAVGMTLVVMTKGIDLSVGSVVGISSMIAASLLENSLWLGVGAGLLAGLCCGLINGILIAKLKLPDFIVTLGTMSIYRGAALIFTNGQPIYSISDDFRSIFAGQLLGIPTPVRFAIAIAILAYLLVRFTSLGEHIIAVGGNEEAARLSGVDVEKVKISVYAISRATADLIFRDAMTTLGVGRITCLSLYSAVRMGGWVTWNHQRKQ